jgi:tetratricopeptide (TPR) repeat protein
LNSFYKNNFRKYRNVAVLFIIAGFFITGCATLKTRTEVAKDYYNMGTQYYSLKLYTEAIDSYEKALKYDPGFKDAKINLIICYQMVVPKQYDKAEKLIIANYKPAANEFNRSLLLLLGNNYFFRTDYEKSLKTFNIYMESYPDRAEGFFNAGLTYQKLNDEQNTLKYFLEAYKVNDKFIPVLYNLADFYFLKKEYDSSIIYFRSLIELDKLNPDVFYKLGQVEYLKEEYEISRDSFNKAIEIDPKNPEYYISIAKVYARAFNNKSKAYSYIEKAFVLGYKDINNIKTIPEFNLLNEYSDYKDLLKRYSN